MASFDLTQLVTAEQRQAQALAAAVSTYSNAIQMHLDAVAALRNYDGIQTAVSYRDDPNPQFAAEASALFVWRSNVWTYATAEMDKVLQGLREKPSVEELIAELEVFTWP